jgi:hypothetical protein
MKPSGEEREVGEEGRLGEYCMNQGGSKEWEDHDKRREKRPWGDAKMGLQIGIKSDFVVVQQ